MSHFAAFFTHPLVERAGWTLVHFLWQGLAAALALRVALSVLKRKSPVARYAAACAILLAMVLAPPATFLCLGDSRAPTPNPAHGSAAAGAVLAPGLEVPPGSDGLPVLQIYQFTAQYAHAAGLRIAEMIRPWLPYSVAAWLLGVTLLSGMLCMGLFRVDRLRRCALEVHNGRLKDVLEALRVRLMLRRPVRLLESTWVEVPSVVGWLRPVILLPASALTGLTLEQLELVLAHELAHIRRHDYAVNLFQAVVETVLFYHPAVWWVSRTIRVEREMCCDDVAIEACDNRTLYARVLTTLEESRIERRHSDVAATGGSLLGRIRRLVGAPEVEGPRRSMGGLAALALVVAAVAVAAFSSLDSTSAGVQDPLASAPEAGVLDGRIEDSAGHPVSGAAITLQHLQGSGRSGGSEPPKLKSMSAVTDASGRWRLAGFPPRVEGSVLLTVEHAKFLHSQLISPGDASLEDLRTWASIFTLKAGQRLEGTVCDREGRPVEGARVRIGLVRSGVKDAARTDASGGFRVENAEEGNTTLVVQAPGCSPWLEIIPVPRDGAVRVQLEAARTIRGRVVDARGNPVAGAVVCPDRWRGQIMLGLADLRTGLDGRFVWLEAPEDVVLFDVWKEGHLTVRKHGLIASGSEPEIVLGPALSLSGAVLEASALKPIIEGTVQVGAERGDGGVEWFPDRTSTFHEGRFEVTIDMPLSRHLWPSCRGYVVRAAADGYRPAVSRPFLEREGEQHFDLVLEPLSGLEWRGIVRSPGGDPAAGARVVLCDAREGVELSAISSVAADASTGTDGRFSLSPRAESRGVVVVHPSGWAAAPADDMAASKDIALEAWGRVEGKLLKRDRPATGERVEVFPEIPGYRPVLVRMEPMTSRTDEAGLFIFDRVPSGRWTLSRSTERGDDQTLLGKRKHIVVAAGESLRVELDGTCATVKGLLAIPPEIASSARPCETTVLLERKPSEALGESDKDLYYPTAGVAADGTFAWEGLPPGNYRLYCEVRETRTTHEPRFLERLAVAERDVMIGGEALDRDAAISLGRIDLEPTNPLRLGEAAPVFELKTAGGATLRLEDFRGKFLLLYFWASWCGPCREQVQSLKRVHSDFGGDPRISILGVNFDRDPGAAARAIAEQGMSWRHVEAGEWEKAAIAKAYRVDGIPRAFLIGPRGELVGKGLYREDIYWDAAQALCSAQVKE